MGCVAWTSRGTPRRSYISVLMAYYLKTDVNDNVTGAVQTPGTIAAANMISVSEADYKLVVGQARHHGSRGWRYKWLSNALAEQTDTRGTVTPSVTELVGTVGGESKSATLTHSDPTYSGTYKIKTGVASGIVETITLTFVDGSATLTVDCAKACSFRLYDNDEFLVPVELKVSVI